MRYDFYIAALGASAGGLKALTSFFSRAVVNDKIAYVVALHSLRDAKSKLASILAGYTSAKIVEITEGMQILPDRIYIHPPAMKVSIIGGKFHLSERPPEEKINRTIDHLYISLAEEAGDKVIGIIMSGTGSDGTAGFHAIESRNGTTIVQDPETAEFDGMPLHSIKYDHPDHVLHPFEIPSMIEEIIRKGSDT